MKKIILITFILLTAITLSGCKKQSPTDEATTDPSAKTEEKSMEKTEELIIKGSDTLLQMVSNLIEEFSEKNSNADLSVTGGGSGTGIAALINGEVQIANSSRDIKQKEIDQAEAGGVTVHEFIVARDGLSVIVHPDNPVKQLTIEELGEMFKGTITNWNGAGGNAGQIVLYGRQSTSGTYGFFRDTVVKDDYSQTMRNMEGNQAIFDAVKSDKNGIGYVGVGYVLDENGNAKEGVKVLKISADAGSEAVSPTDKKMVEAGKYPLTRPLYHYLNGIPEKNSIVHKLLMFEASTDGKTVIEATGFFAPFPADVMKNKKLLDSIN